MPDPNWIDDFFIRDAQVYYDTYLHHLTPQATQHQIEGLINALDLQSNQRILDLACGHGRHATDLALQGYSQVTGLDYSPVFLEKARSDAEAAGVVLEWLQGDMRSLAFESEFDAVYNIFTSLFYFEDETNQAVLDGVGKALRPGGRFLVDTMNPLAIIRRGPGQTWEPLPNGGWMLERWSYQPQTGRNEAERHIVMPTGRHIVQEFFVRVYTAPEMERMFRRANLSLVALYGDFSLAPYGLDSARLIAVAEKR